jgi:diphthine methyl ester acylhydrolase
MNSDGTELDRYDTSAILDVKFSHQLIRDKTVFGSVTSQGTLLLHSIENQRLELLEHVTVIPQLLLSLDWQNRLGGGEDILAVSGSDGSIHVMKPTESEYIVDQSYQAHGFEAWITAFDYHKRSVLYSGGDDCLFKIWDLNSGNCVVENKVHEAGVTTISSHPLLEHVLVTGSYDEFIRVWDTRLMRQPVHSISTGGGVWRLRWHPKDPSLLLAACMYNDFHIYDFDTSFNYLHRMLEYRKHESIAYGADWSFLEDDLIGTASFYDHYVTMWRM